MPEVDPDTAERLDESVDIGDRMGGGQRYPKPRRTDGDARRSDRRNEESCAEERCADVKRSSFIPENNRHDGAFMAGAKPIDIEAQRRRESSTLR